MRVPLVVSIAAMLVSLGCTKSRPSESSQSAPSATAKATLGQSEPGDAEAKWVLGEGKYQGRPLIMRVRETIAKVPDPARKTRLTVRYEYGDGGVDGLPSTAMLAPLEAFEDRLFRALERGGAAIGVAVATTGGGREFIFYVSDPQAPLDRFNDEFGKDPEPYPVKLSTVEDPGWAEYQGILKRFGSP